jgi:2-methylcitrate dehydratase PrpD
VLTGGALLVAEPIERKRDPRNLVEAQFSAPFGSALALVRGSAGYRDFTPANLEDETIRNLMTRTDCVRDPALDARYPQEWPAWVELRLRDGQLLRSEIRHASGEPENPVSRAALIEKFVDLAGGGIPRARALEVADHILRMDDLADVEVLAL